MKSTRDQRILAENEELRNEVRELRETLDAISSGEVDAIVVTKDDRKKIYTLDSEDQPYRVLVENIQEGALTLSSDGMILYGNSAFAKLTGRPLHGILGTKLGLHIAPRDRVRFDLLFRESLTKPVKSELGICRADGSVPVHLSMTALDVNGDTKVIAIFTDRLQDYHQLLLQGRMLDSVADAVIASDNAGRIIYWNKAATALYGWEAGEVAGRKIDDILAPEFSIETLRIIKDHLVNGRSWWGEHPVKKRDGNSFMVYSTNSPVFDDDGQLIAVLWASHDITERKMIETELKKNESQYRTVADNTYDFEFWIAPDGHYIYASPSCRKIYLRNNTEFLANPHLQRDVVHPEDLALFDGHCTGVEEQRQPGEVEYRINRPDGTECWISHACQPVFDESGNYLGIRGSNRDITERKQSELRIQEVDKQNKLLADIIEGASLPFCIGYPDGSIGLMNKAFEDLVGYDRNELATQTWSQSLTPPEWQQFESSMLKSLSLSGRPVTYEKEYIRKNGSKIPVELLVNVVRDTDGSPLYYYAFVTDLTERKKIQSNLILQAILLNNISDAVVSFDPGFRITSWNPAAEKMYGWSAKEALGKSSIEILQSATGEEGDLIGRARVQDGSVTRTEQKHLRKDGTGFWVDSVFQALHDQKGRIIGFLSVNRDITHRKEIEAALLESEEKFRIIATNTPDHIIMQDRDLRYTFVINPQLGLMEGDMIGKTDYELLAPDDAEKITKIKNDVISSKNPFHADVPLQNLSGGTEYFEGTYVPRQDRDGNVIGIIGYFTNVTERKKMESDLMNALSLINASLESTADGLLVMNSAGQITSYNRNFQEMWKIPDDVMETGDEILLLESLLMQVKDPDSFLEEFFELDRHPDRESYDMLELVSGRIFERFSKPQKIGNTMVGRVWSFRDVTDRKQAEQRLIESLHEKEVLLREIHHRVKNNLQLVSGLLDMTRMRTKDPVTHTILTDVMLKIQTMAQIHTRLYESRQFGKINIKEQIRDQVASLSSVYSPKGQDVTCEIESDEIVIPVDQAIPCALVVNEILSNAYKHAFRDRRQGYISVMARRSDNRVRIQIRDDGVGLPDGFDPNLTTSLGIKLIRTLMRQQLKGLFEIRSDKGTEVVVEFPVLSTEA